MAFRYLCMQDVLKVKVNGNYGSRFIISSSLVNTTSMAHNDTINFKNIGYDRIRPILCIYNY